MAAGLLVGSVLRTPASSRPQGTAREFTVTGDHFAFAPPRIEVQKDDLVKITFTARDIAAQLHDRQLSHRQTGGRGQSVTFEFRADQVGTHRFYCNLTQDDRCRRMEGQLIVR